LVNEAQTSFNLSIHIAPTQILDIRLHLQRDLHLLARGGASQTSPVLDAAAHWCCACAPPLRVPHHVSSLAAAARHLLDWQLNHPPLFVRCAHFDWANI
jgi:hypothetical protein